MTLRGWLVPGRRDGTLVAAYLGVALIFGGGGTPSAAAEIIVQLGFAAAFLVWMAWPGNGRDAMPRPLIVFAAILCLLPLVQLVPLPPAIWHGLPGRGAELAALQLVGEADHWKPLSVAPYSTLASLLAIIPGVGLMLATAQLDLRARRLLLVVISLATLGAIALGALQVAGGSNGEFQLYEISHRGWLTGFFANRNAAVDALLIGMMAGVAVLARRNMTRGMAASGGMGLLVVAVGLCLAAAVMTGSRAGIVLIPLALVFVLFLVRGHPGARRAYKGLAIVGALAVLVLALPLFTGDANRVTAVAGRFAEQDDPRGDIWRDSLAAIAATLPTGAGIGTFTRVYPAHERIEQLSETFANRAHNDYLEFLLEAGLAAPILLVAGGMVLVLRARRGFAAGGEARQQAIFATGTLAILALHSLVDYPLRTMALAALAGVAAAMLAPPDRTSAQTDRRGAAR